MRIRVPKQQTVIEKLRCRQEQKSAIPGFGAKFFPGGPTTACRPVKKNAHPEMGVFSIHSKVEGRQLFLVAFSLLLIGCLGFGVGHFAIGIDRDADRPVLVTGLAQNDVHDALFGFFGGG